MRMAAPGLCLLAAPCWCCSLNGKLIGAALSAVLHNLPGAVCELPPAVCAVSRTKGFNGRLTPALRGGGALHTHCGCVLRVPKAGAPCMVGLCGVCGEANGGCGSRAR